MPRAVAVNVGANTTLPGFRGPLLPDGSFAYVPIPEREPASVAPVDEPFDPHAGVAPTYAHLAPHLPVDVPDDLRERPVHLDPAFAEYPCCSAYTYGDEHGVKARPLADLEEGDYAVFYATLTTATREGDAAGEEAGHPPWVPPRWGAYLIGHFRLDVDPVTGEEYRDLPPAERERHATNAHVRRETVDARVLLSGDPDDSALYDRAVPLSTPDAGADAGPLVTERSNDSGKGPWWRRPLRFDADGTAALLDARERYRDR